MSKHMYILADGGRIAASDLPSLYASCVRAAGLTAGAPTGSTW